MGHVNVEFKARLRDRSRIHAAIKARNARFVGRDHQIDTYFNVPRGRLKLREGTIENALIFYHRADEKAARRSDVMLYHPEPFTTLKSMLTQALGVRIIVEKDREIFFIENVKIHLDHVRGLGEFLEVEAIDATGEIGEDRLRESCGEYLDLFGIGEDDLLARSYSDLLADQSAG